MEELLMEQTTERLVASNEALLRAYRELDLTSGNSIEQLEALAKLQHEVVEDTKNETNRVIVKEQLEADERKAEKESKGRIFGNILQGVGIAVTLGLGVAQLLSDNWRFERATRKEEDEAILTTTDRTVVTDGLRSKPNQFKLPFFK